MKIVVCIKQVPRRDDLLRINADKTWVDQSSLSFEANESDAYALEEALRLKEKHGGKATALCLGPESARRGRCKQDDQGGPGEGCRSRNSPVRRAARGSRRGCDGPVAGSGDRPGVAGSDFHRPAV